MSQSYPNEIENLSQTYFGELVYQFSGKSSNLTQDLTKTYFGECLSGNDWGSAAPPAAAVYPAMMFMLIAQGR